MIGAGGVDGGSGKEKLEGVVRCVMVYVREGVLSESHTVIDERLGGENWAHELFDLLGCCVVVEKVCRCEDSLFSGVCEQRGR